MRTVVTILNTSILTEYGFYSYKKITVDSVKQIINSRGFDSAVGHQSTAEVLTCLLGVPVPVKRIQYRQDVGETAIVFKLNGRPEEGKILTSEEIESIGYEFGILTRNQ